MLARLLCPGYCTPCHLPVCLFAGQAIVPRLLCPGYCTPCHLPAFLPVSCPGYSAQATEHPASCLPVCLQATLPRLLHTQATACLPVCCQATLPLQTLPLPACLFAGQATLPRLLHPAPCHLPACQVCWPGYSAQATAHPGSTCLLGGQATLPRLLHTLPPACLFAAQATLPRLLHTLPPACLPVCWPGYSACERPCRLTACLPACLACLFAGQATLPRLLHTLPPDCLPACLLPRLLCPGY